MTQSRRCEKALALIQPVWSAVSARRPKGFSMKDADELTIHLKVATAQLEAALELYERAAGGLTERLKVEGAL